MIKHVVIALLLSGASAIAATPHEHFVRPRPAVTFPVSFWKASGPTPTATATATATASATATATATVAPTPTPSPSPGFFTGTYVSDGDTNGILYFMGKGLDVGGSWSNPFGVEIDIVMSTNDSGAGTEGRLCDHVNTADITTQGIANSWEVVDLGPGRTLVVTVYSLQNRNGFTGDHARAIRNWKLQGTNSTASNSVADLAAATWTDIDVRVADTTMATTAQSWGTYTVSGTPSAYRWLRILQNGTNALGDDYLVIGEIEFYGDLTY